MLQPSNLAQGWSARNLLCPITSNLTVSLARTGLSRGEGWYQLSTPVAWYPLTSLWLLGSFSTVTRPEVLLLSRENKGNDVSGLSYPLGS